MAQRRTPIFDAAQRLRPAMLEVASRTRRATYLLAHIGFDAFCIEMMIGTAPTQTLIGGVGGRVPLGIGPGASPCSRRSTMPPAIGSSPRTRTATPPIAGSTRRWCARRSRTRAVTSHGELMTAGMIRDTVGIVRDVAATIGSND